MTDTVPFIGAEVFIEPGQTPAEIDLWFNRMKACGMTVARVRLFESYMRNADGTWDYSLFDEAFRAGEKYGIGIYGNLFPHTSFTDVGGFKFPADERHLAGIGDYIRHVVTHFSGFSSLCGWVPINEPGSGSLPDTEFTRLKFLEWKAEVRATDYLSNGYNVFDFLEQRFLVYYTTWFLEWLVSEIAKYDPGRPVHVNNHAIFQHVAEYDFPAWSKSLTTLGGSAHASWHFGYFSRSRFTVGMSAKSEIIRSGAGNIPWFMTELQGGNNLYSAFHPLCPTKEEISQWLWIIIATGARGAIFWCLNARGSGFEAGEWALLNFQNAPSDRMLAAADVVATLNKYGPLFAGATVIESGINILYIREAMWIEKALQVSGTSYEGREEGSVMKSALGWFEALGEMGVQANFKEIGEFDFTKEDYDGVTVILSHQVSIPSRYWSGLEKFVKNGGKLIADGLTGFYDEHAHCVMKTGFSLREVFGGTISEFKLVGNLFPIELPESGITLHAHLWRGSIHLGSGQPLSWFDREVTACRNTFGRGEVLWIPSLIGLGCRITADYSPLAALLFAEAAESIGSVPLRFNSVQPGLIMKSLGTDNAIISVLINKSGASKNVAIQVKDQLLRPDIIFSSKQGGTRQTVDTIDPEETIVVRWRLKLRVARRTRAG